jgi:3-methyladenine DNA glycosylase AlkD
MIMIKSTKPRACRESCGPLSKSGAPSAKAFSAALRQLANPAKARLLQSFFKTGPGQYAEGDRFLGVMVPQTRALVREFRLMTPREAVKLVDSKWHEERLAGLLVWVRAFEKGDAAMRTLVLGLYLANLKHINNWDLVDLSAPQIVGGSLAAGNFDLLLRLAQSPVLWERRVSVVATAALIRRGEFKPTLDLCRRLLGDPEDLMHKACGWMLREIGKRDRACLTAFITKHAAKMPRTMLRYAIEHYPEEERQKFLAAKPPRKPL